MGSTTHKMDVSLQENGLEQLKAYANAFREIAIQESQKIKSTYSTIYEKIMAKFQSLTPEAKIAIGSTTLLAFTALIFYVTKTKKAPKSSKNSETDIPAETYEKLKADITKEILLNESFTSEKPQNFVLDKLEEVEKELSKIISDLPSFIEEMNELKTEQEFSKCSISAQKKMHEHLHEKIEEILTSSKKIDQMQDQVNFRQNQQDCKIDDLERTLDDFMNKSAELENCQVRPSNQHLSSFKENVMNEVEDWVRSNNQNEKRKMENELNKIKEENFIINESASRNEQIVAQEMRDLHLMLQDSEKRLKSQMCQLEDRMNSTRNQTNIADQNKTFTFDGPQLNKLPPSSNTSGVSMAQSIDERPGSPQHKSTPLENSEIRKVFPSKIRPPNSEYTPMAKQLSKNKIQMNCTDECKVENGCGDVIEIENLANCQKS